MVVTNPLQEQSTCLPNPRAYPLGLHGQQGQYAAHVRDRGWQGEAVI
jgi:hypothetical protein